MAGLLREAMEDHGMPAADIDAVMREIAARERLVVTA
jgi:hypothetical protein